MLDWAKAINESTQAIAKEIAAFKTSNTAQSRKQLFEKKLSNLPEKLKAKALKDFERMSFDDDDAFNAFVEESEADFKEFAQDEAESGLVGGKPLLPGNSKGGENDVSPSMKAFIINRAKAVEAQQTVKTA